MKKKLLSGVLAFALAAVGVLSAQMSVHAAKIPTIYDDSGTFDEEGEPTQDAETNSLNYEVQAKTTGGGDIVYSVTVSWGALQFEYDYGSTWDPVNHEYTNTDGSQNLKDGKWNLNYLDGDNNSISVQNDSNYPVDVKFEYNNLESNPNVFNEDPTSSTAVAGYFDISNDSLKGVVSAGAINTQNIQPLTLSLNMCKDSLQSGDRYYANKYVADGTYQGEVFFSLVGKPDRGVKLRSMQPVGSIKVTITPTPITKVTQKAR